ncbi:MAG: Uma2 family endonuclease [Bacteroidota bacterium]
MSVSFSTDKTDYTFEEYLAVEEQAEVRHEYHDGRVVAKMGGTGSHSLILGSLCTALNIAIDEKDKNCFVFNRLVTP